MKVRSYIVPNDVIVPAPQRREPGKMRRWCSDDTVRWDRKGVTYSNFRISHFVVRGTGNA